MTPTCTHLDQIQGVTPSSPGCEDCLAAQRRGPTITLVD